MSTLSMADFLYITRFHQAKIICYFNPCIGRTVEHSDRIYLTAHSGLIQVYRNYNTSINVVNYQMKQYCILSLA
jgi:hypothetical protein